MIEKEKYELIPIDKILEPEISIRESVDEDKLKRLTNSIRDIGQEDPIKVKEEGDNYRIITGHLRYLALCKLGIPLVKALITEPTEEEELAWRVHENVVRVEQDPLGEALYYDLLQKKYGLTAKGVAEKIKVPASRVRRRLGLLVYPKDIKDAVRENKISLGVAKYLARVPNDKVRRMLLSRAIRDGLTKSRARIWAEEYKDVGKKERPPSKKKVEKKIREMKEYYSSPCEICGGKVKRSDWGTVEGHFKCLKTAQRLVWQKLEEQKRKEKEEAKKEKESQDGKKDTNN